MKSSVLAFLAVVCLAAPAAATDYYVSASGNDGHAGTSAATAWRTLARANDASFKAGDRLLLEGGVTFAGNLVFDAFDGGTPEAPLTLASWGDGRATIAASSGTAVVVYNRAAFVVRDLVVTGAGLPGTSGIVFYGDEGAAGPLAYVRIEDVEVTGFGADGIQVGVWSGADGFADVRIVRAVAHGNARTGILTYADRPTVHRDVYVGYSRAFDNRGIPGAATNTGSGIVLGAVSGGTVERSVAHHNGALSTATEGPVGIWAYDSTRILIQHNESYANRTGGPADGGGFDFDQNVSDSILQFNYSHDNDGAGYLLAHRYADDRHSNNVLRFNVSHGDGRRNGYGGIEIWGRTVGARIHHNTVIAADTSGAAVKVANSGIGGVRSTGVSVFSNILHSRVRPIIQVSPDQLLASPLRLVGNTYHGGALAAQWGGASLAGLAALRSFGQESWEGAPTGVEADAMLAWGTAVALDDATRLETLDAYRLAAASPAAGTAFDVRLAGIDAGPADFFGAAPQPGDPGASSSAAIQADGEREPQPDAHAEIVIHAANGPIVTGNWRIVSDATAAGGAALADPNRDAAKVSAPRAEPADYAELTFMADAGRGYRVWIRGRAERDTFANDSVFVQFSGSVDAQGAPAYRIGSTSAMTITLEDCVSCGLAGWGWQDNGFGLGVLGPLVYFETSGPQTVRLQRREDGIVIDQIVLSSARFVESAPGSLKHDATILAATGVPAAEPPVVTEGLEVAVWAAASHPLLVGNWAPVADATAAGGVRLQNANRHAAKLAQAAADPVDYVELAVEVAAGVPYRLWLRGKARGNEQVNDSVFVQFSGAVDAAGAGIYRLGTTSAIVVNLEDCSACGLEGWGWQDNGFGAGVLGPVITFAESGRQTIRIQPREDGLSFDQLVLSAADYLLAPPGLLREDATILAPQ